jgi:hypothetical protein
LEEHNSAIKNLYFKAFRAVDDRAACMKFIEGHTHVLEIYGITQITSAKIDWVINPDVYVIQVMAEENGKALAGGRIHVANGINPLPIETAVGLMDERIYDLVASNKENGIGEFCGLWNSWEIAGMGIGSIHLGRTFIALAHHLKLGKLLGLCAPATYRNSLRVGFRVLRELGVNGKFYYPAEDLTATGLIIEDLENLPHAVDEERDIIKKLTDNSLNKLTIKTNKGEEVTLHFDLFNT